MCHPFSNLWILEFTEIHRIWMLKVLHVIVQNIFMKKSFKIVNKVYVKLKAHMLIYDKFIKHVYLACVCITLLKCY